MERTSRREFMRASSLGLAAVGGGGLALTAHAAPTAGSGTIGTYGQFLQAGGEAVPAAGTVWRPTEDNILGPFHRKGAPFRAKITPPMEPGDVLLISGRVWAHDSKKPLSSAVIDIWQANKDGRYDNDDPKTPPARNVFLNRARLVTDENGYYEYETIMPGRYKIGASTWRPAHIHYMVRYPGYSSLITQLYFKGDPKNSKDRFIKKSLIIDLAKAKSTGGEYRRGEFDIVLAKA